MPIIFLKTEIRAPRERCFDLSRSIDLHRISVQHTREEAVRGIMRGLISLHESVTWQAMHFGIRLELTSKITEFCFPNYFVDEMTEGVFKSLWHKHEFDVAGDRTIMTDDFRYESPGGIFGKIFNKIVLTPYLTRLLLLRNKILKQYAESDLWKDILINK